MHLLPAYDFGSVNEDRWQWKWPRGGLDRLPPESEDQQQAVSEVQDQDAYNWGCDPRKQTAQQHMLCPADLFRSFALLLPAASSLSIPSKSVKYLSVRIRIARHVHFCVCLCPCRVRF